MMSSGSSEIYVVAFFACILITISTKFRFFMKMGIFMVGSILLATFLPIPLFILRPKDYRNALMPAWGCRILGHLLGASFEVRGIENVNKKKGGVVIMNHQSCIDLTVLAYLWPLIGRATVVAKQELFYAFPFGLAAYLWGTLYINRSKKTEAFDRLTKESNAINKKSCKLLFFPEGTRHQGDKLLPFKKGAFHIAIQSQSMIQPVVISKYLFLNSDKKYFGRGHSIISILPEIDCSNMTKDDIPKLIEDTQCLMQKYFDELTDEMRHSNYIKLD